MKELSYNLGLLVGSNLANQVNADDLDLLSLARGIEDYINGNVEENKMEEAVRHIQSYMQDVMSARAEQAIVEESNFLTENAKNAGVVALASGLQYEVLKEGNGKIPKASNVVMAHYEGRLLDGSVFDSSVARGQAAQFPVGNLIAGWQEALQLMPTGSKWRLYIPSSLGYGAEGAGNDIPPFATLIFDLELLDIVG